MRFQKVYIDYTFPALIALFLVFNGDKLLWATSCAAAAHEAGHYIAIRLLGGKITEIRLSCTGAYMQYSLRRNSYGRDAFICLAGPVAGAALTAVAAAFSLPLLAGASVLLTAFNLMPASMMDGGRILYAAAAHMKGTQTAERLVFATSCFSATLLSCFGAIALKTRSGSFTLLLMGIWIFSVSVLRCCKKNSGGV